MTATVFRLRAECMVDVAKLLSRFLAERVEIVAIDLPLADVVVTITGPVLKGEPLDLASLRSICRAVVDGHVMVETLAPLAEYTGERSYGEPRKGRA